jgi:uncharacterized lipoprotein YddW (UPF0748 family)
MRKKLFYRRKNLVIATLIIFLIWFLKPAPSFQGKNDQDEEIRGVWMTNVGVSLLHHSTLLDNVFHHLARSGYNRIYLSTYGYTGTIYPSKQVKSNPFFLPPFTDVLKASEKEAKRQGLKLYAWLE